MRFTPFIHMVTEMKLVHHNCGVANSVADIRHIYPFWILGIPQQVTRVVITDCSYM
jgi:hypothetical protein